MKKIFIEASLFGKEEQGSLTYLREIYKIITDKRKGNKFIFGAYNIEILKKTFGEHKDLIYYKYFFKNKFVRLFFETPYILWKKKIDFAHFQYLTPFVKPSTCNYIVTIHDVLFLDFKKEFTFTYRLIRTVLFYLSSRISSLVLTVSDYSRLRISHHFSIDINKIKITSNAVSENYYNCKISKKDSKEHVKKFNIYNDFVLYVSRIELRKNQLLALDLFENKISTDNVFTIVFVGHNSHSTGFIDRFNLLKSKYPQNIFYFESLDFFDLINFYNSAKVFLYPSKCEGFGIPPLEAAVMKTPVICSNLTAMKDFDFFQPFMFNPNNQNMVDVYNNFELNENLIDYEKIRNQIIDKYNWNNSANLLIDYFNNSKNLS